MSVTVYPLELSPATLGQPYSDPDAPQLVATGGAAPYTWAVTLGALPPGLSLNPTTGVIAGAPVLADQYVYAAGAQYPTISQQASFTVTATDDAAATGSRAYTLPVGLFSEDEAVSIHEMLDAVYVSDYYVMMDNQGTRYLRIGNVLPGQWGGIRLIINCYLQNMSRGVVKRMRQHIRKWDKISGIALEQNNGAVADITGLNNNWEKERELLLRKVKVLLPVKTRAECDARDNRGGGNDSVGSVSGGRGGGVTLQR